MKLWLRLALGAVVLIALLGGIGLWLAQSDWLREKFRAEIIAQAERATGGKVDLKNFRFDWHTLTADLGPFVIHGTEPTGAEPLLSVERVRVALQVLSLISRDFRIAGIEAFNPKAHLILAADGKTNIPQPKLTHAGKGPAETILDLKIAKFDVRNGWVLVEAAGQPPVRKPWEARGEQLEAQVQYETAGPRYSGNVSLGALRLRVPSFETSIQVAAHASMEQDRILVSSATLKTAKSEIDLKNTVLNHFAAPVLTGQYEAKLALGEFTKAARGAVSATGSGRFVSVADYQISGKLQGAGVSFDVLRNMGVAADFEAVPDKISLKRATVRVLGGEVAGAAEIQNIERFKASGRLESFDLAQVAALRTKQHLPYDAVISGPFDIQGTMKRQTGSAQLTISPVKTGAPVRGLATVKFDTAAGKVELGHSYVDLPHSHVEVDGTLGQQLDVKLDSRDANDLLPLLLDAPKPELSYGGLTFNGTVTGPLDHPKVAGFAAARGVLFRQQTIDSVSADFTATENKLTVGKSEASSAGIQGRVSGSLDLAKWQVSEASAVAATVDVGAADLTKILALAGEKEVQFTGTLGGTAQVSGTLGDPKATADLTLSKGSVYGQPFDSIAGRAQLLGRNAQTFTGLFISGPKRVNISSRFDHPGTAFPAGNLEFNLTSNTMPLNEINLVRERQPDIHGFGKFHADGVLKISRDPKRQIQFDIANLNADATANGLELGGRNLGDARFTAQTKGSVLEARFDSNAAKASIHGEGTVQLTGDYTIDGKVKFLNAGLNALAALIVKSNDARSLNFDGTAEGELDIRGPARHPEELTASLDIPKIEVHPLAGSDFAHSLPNFVVSNNGPIRVSLTKSQIRVESARLKAPETDLTLTGTVALGEPQTLALRVQGSMNLALARTLSPDLTASGNLSLDGAIRGSVNTPDVSGRATLRNGEFHYADFSNGLTNVAGEIAFNGTRATIQSLTAESGGGKVDATGFAALSNGLVSFRIQTRARSVRVRYPEGVSSISDADLTMVGTSQRSDVSGAITVHRVAINPKSDAATILALSAQPLKTASAQNGIAANMNLDVQISTAPDVALQTSVTESIQADANLRLRGTVTNPALLGRINVTQGEMVFLSNKYSINQGTISFFNPAKIEPILNIDLETKARGVDVILTVSGPIEKLNLTYRSDPPLQFSDIVALLAAGRTPTDPTLAVRDTGQTQSFQQLGADTLIGQAIANPVAGRLQRFFGVSRIKIDPQLTGITGSPQARLTIEQQITPEILFTYITDVSSTSTQLIRVEWAFNKTWSAILIREENGYVGLDFAYKKRFK